MTPAGAPPVAHGDDWRRMAPGDRAVVEGLVHDLAPCRVSLEIQGGEMLDVAVQPGFAADAASQRLMIGARRRLDVVATAAGWSCSPEQVSAMTGAPSKKGLPPEP